MKVHNKDFQRRALGWAAFLWLFAVTVIGGVLMSSPTYAKRAAPAEIAAVLVDGNKVAPERVADQSPAGNKGYDLFLTCTDAASGQPVWKTKLLHVAYDQQRETDVQDVNLVSLMLAHGLIVAMDEKGQQYRVNAKDGALQTPATFASYPRVSLNADRSELTRDQAVEIATKRAKAQANGLFKTPYAKTVERQRDNGNWVVKLLSEAPREGLKLGGMYLTLVIDQQSGAILVEDLGGGS